MEIDLLRNYPKAKRDLSARLETKSEEVRNIAKQFGQDFFDGDRDCGYGGFNYHARFWQDVIPDFIDHWGLHSGHSILDIGCAKGFMIHDFLKAIPALRMEGIDISEYAVNNGHSPVQNLLKVASCDRLPYEDNSFDYAISVNSIHNLDKEGVIKSLKEINRVTTQGSFITVDAYRDDEEKARMYAWNLTAKTILHVDEWKELFIEANYEGDYFWFIP
jgi:ubiquinone/menaquinone biosynthesis C-methylase UbiE